MNWYKLAQSYKTKEGEPITFQAIPFNEHDNDRGFRVHKIKAFVSYLRL